MICRLTISVLLMIPLLVFPQKEDYNWITGGCCDTTKNFIQFSDTGYDIDTIKNKENLEIYRTNGSFSSNNGDLLLYSSGISIYDKSHSIINNGDNLNPGWTRNEWAPFKGAYPLINGLTFVNSYEDNEVFCFHLRGDSVVTGNPQIDSDGAILDLSLTTIFSNGDSSAVLSKNIPLIQDTLTNNGVSLCRHGNGRDWWIIVAEAYNNCYYTLLMTPDTIELIHQQCLGVKSHWIDFGQSFFTPDGSKFIRGSNIDGLEIFDFDRCSGLLSNERDPLQGIFENYSGLLGPSPNSRFLYFFLDTILYQFDIQANNFYQSRIEIHNIGSPPFTYGFSAYQLGPDGKLYISGGTWETWSIIHNPNELGTACNLEIQAPLLVEGSDALPNFPNFRLGALIGSPCDTLNDTVDVVDAILLEQNLDVYPNPTSDFVRIEYGNFLWNNKTNFSLQITNLLGQTYLAEELPQYSLYRDVSVEHYPKGIYFVQLYANGEFVGKRKLIVE